MLPFSGQFPQMPRELVMCRFGPLRPWRSQQEQRTFRSRVTDFYEQRRRGSRARCFTARVEQQILPADGQDENVETLLQYPFYTGIRGRNSFTFDPGVNHLGLKTGPPQ